MIHVMTKNGKSYANIKNGHASEKWRVNGCEPSWGNGDDRWCVISGEITSIEKYTAGARKEVQWKRSVDAPRTLPETIPLDRVERDEDWDYHSIDGYDLSNYYMETEETPGKWEQVEFKCIDRDCEPVQLPPWCVVEWPANVEHFPEQQHKHPCHITAKSLFEIIVGEVAAVIGQSKELTWDDYRNIGCFTVKKRLHIPEPLRRLEKREYYKTLRSKKASIEYITPEWKWVDVVRVNGFYRESSRDEIKVPSLKGENYAELKKAVDEYVAWIVDLCDESKWCVCGACEGRGMKRCEG